MLENKRFITLAGVTNFRDVGGYAAANGKSVKWGKLYRSGDLDALTDADLDILAGLGLKTIVDFRTPFEIAAAPDRVPPGVNSLYSIVIDSESVFDLADVRETNAEKHMQRLNVVMVHEYRKAFAEFFSILARPANIPLLCHCSAGKDRTGLAVALFLAALGVDRETIYEDYLISGPFAVAKYGRILERYPELLPVMTVKKEYLQAAFDEIDKCYGGTEAYLTKELKVDLARFIAEFTE